MSEIEGFIVSDPLSLLYLTGTSLEAGHLLITEEKALLILPLMYEQTLCPGVEVVCTKELPFQQFFHKPSHSSTKVGFNSSVVTVETLKGWKKQGRGITFKASSLLQEMRQVKDKEEIVLLKKATEMAMEGMNYLESKLAVNMTEVDLYEEFTLFLKKNKGAESSFLPTIAFGKNTSSPHHRPTATVLKEGDPILIDMGVKLDNYCSDITRMFCLGEMPEGPLKLYEICKEAHDCVLEVCKVGLPLGKLYDAAFTLMQSYGLEERFLHALGHSIGLSVHEFPIFRKKMERKAVMQEGMVFTIEPGLYLRGLYGARYENMVLIEKGKAHLLP